MTIGEGPTMPAITISTPENTPSLLTRDEITDPAIRSKLSQGDLGTHVRHHHRDGPDQLNLFEVVLEPNGELSPHGHVGDEILYVLEGEMRLGGRVVRPGSSVLIRAMTAYLIKAGPEGLRFLNFFGRLDGSTYLHRDDLIAMRGSADTVADPGLIRG
jgi:quercetin dioxygenase-like cupin family protein